MIKKQNKRGGNRFLQEKKAVSEMVGYVILISIAIGLAIGVFSWLKDYANVTPKIDCKPGTSIILEDHSYAEGIFTINIKNNGMFDIGGIFMMVGNNSNRQPIERLPNIMGDGNTDAKGYYTGKINVSENQTIKFLSSLNEIQIVQIQPFILDKKGKKILCESGVIKEKLVDSASPGGGTSFPIPLEGLISWWKFDGNYNDFIGSNHGVAQGDANTTGNISNLDGVNDYVNIPVSASIANKNQNTISAWVKSNSVAVSQVIYSEDKAEGTDFFFKIGGVEEGEHATFAINNASGWYKAIGSTTLQNGIWYHIVATFSNLDGMKVYVNGELNGSDSNNIPTTAAITNIQIGEVSNGGGSSYFNGSIDDVMIYGRALNSTEISDIYNNQSTEKIA